MTTAFNMKNVEKSIILAALIVMAFSSIVPSVAQVFVSVTLMINPVGGGSITTTPVGYEFPTQFTTQTPVNFYLNESYPMTATPSTGYKFSYWTSTGSITFTNPYSSTTDAVIKGTGTITAVFTLIYQPVTFNITPLDAGSINIFLMEIIDQTLTSQTTLNLLTGYSYQLTAAPKSGYIFSRWSYTGSINFTNPNSALTTATIYGSGTITAVFIPRYQVTFSTRNGGGSTTSPSGTQTYNAGQVISITANVASGYMFVSWTATGSVTFANSSAATTTATVNGNANVTAVFTPRYQITFTTGGGGPSTISPSGTQIYDAGQAVSITAYPANSYSFSSWTATGSITFANASSTSTTATINGNGTITAIFTAQYQVTFRTSGGGTSTTSPSGTQTYVKGQTVPISVHPATGYSFVSWTATGSITFANPNAASTTASVNGPGTITANFNIPDNPVQVTFRNGGGGSSTTSPSGTQTFERGQIVPITAYPAGDFVFSVWRANPPDAVSFANPSSASTTATITGNVTIIAEFTAKVTPVPDTPTPTPPNTNGHSSPSPTETPNPSDPASTPSTPDPTSPATPPEATLSPSPSTQSYPTPTNAARIMDVVEVTAAVLTSVVIVLAVAGLYFSYLLRPSLKKFGKDLQNRRAKEAKREQAEDKDKDRDRKKKKPFLKLEVQVPRLLWGSKSAVAEGKLLNQGVASAQDIRVSAVAAPGLIMLNKNPETISTLRPFEDKPLSFPFTASDGIKRGNYKLRFEVKSKETASRVKYRSMRATKIAILSDVEGQKGLVSLKKWLSNRAILWDELADADNYLKLLNFDLLIVSYASEMPLKWVKNLNNFVDDSQSLLVVARINASDMEQLSKTLGFESMRFKDFGSAARSLTVLDNKHEATKMLGDSELPLPVRGGTCTSKVDKGAMLAKVTIKTEDGAAPSSDFSAIVANNYGDGRTVYLNFCPEEQLSQQNEMFEGIFNWLLFKNNNCALGEEELS